MWSGGLKDLGFRGFEVRVSLGFGNLRFAALPKVRLQGSYCKSTLTQRPGACSAY